MSETAQGAHDARDDGFEASEFVVGLGRGLAGALLFALPMQMTMEMWDLGHAMDRWRLLALMLLAIPLLVGIAHRIGFERTFTWREGMRDAMVAFALGIVASGLILALFGLLDARDSLNDIVGKIAVQAVPAGIGALLGRSQLGSGGEEEAEEDEPGMSYGSELFMMAVGALFLNLNMAPTEEMVLISYIMTPWHALLTILCSIAVMHGFVYAVSFKGGQSLEADTPWWHALIRFTLPGYAIALLISLYSLWSFGRLDDAGSMPVLMSMIVLGFPGAVGAAAARLIL